VPPPLGYPELSNTDTSYRFVVVLPNRFVQTEYTHAAQTMETQTTNNKQPANKKNDT